MAFLRDVYAGHGSPVVYTDPRNGDLVIMGQAYDTATMMPKMGRNVVMSWDQSASTVDQTTAHFDADSLHRHAPLSGDANFYRNGTVFSTNHPQAHRSIEDERVIVADAWYNAYYARTDMRGRDWLEDPVKIMTHYEPTNRYYVTHDTSIRTAAFSVYEASDNMPIGQQERFSISARTGQPGICFGMTDDGLVGSGPYNNTGEYCDALYRHNFSGDSNLEAISATQLYIGSTTVRNTMNKLTQMDNGDIIVYQQNESYQRVLRYVNSTGAVTVERQDIASYPITSIPSNVVRHGGSTKKISIHVICDANSPNAWDLLTTTMDVATGDLTVNRHSTLNDGGPSTSLTMSEPSPAYVGNYFETRIISPYGLGHDTEKSMMIWQGSTSLDDQETQTCFDNAAENFISIGVLNSTGTSYRARYSSTWTSVLTDSTRNNNDIANRIPWCVAPLNPEHTLMMVFCQYTTHIVKLSVSGSGNGSTYTLEEVWFDENTIFTQAMWMPTGKVITAEWDERFRHSTSPGIIDDQRLALQVWTEDQIYKLDILPDTQYVAYAGSNLSANVGFNAYDANNELVSTSLKVEITGPAQFDNASTIKTFTTSASANTVETITITDDGQIEFRVLEVQSI